MASLETLPAEMIVKIAQFANTPAVLRLALVSKRLRQACYDHSVFLAHLKDPTHMIKHLGPDALKDTNLLARYALAGVWGESWLNVNMMRQQQEELLPPLPLARSSIAMRVIGHGKVLTYFANLMSLKTPSMKPGLHTLIEILGSGSACQLMMQVPIPEFPLSLVAQRSWYAVWAFLVALVRLRTVISPSLPTDTNRLSVLLERNVYHAQSLLDLIKNGYSGLSEPNFVQNFHVGCTLGVNHMLETLQTAWHDLDHGAWEGIRLPSFKNRYHCAQSLPKPFARPSHGEQDWISFVAEQRTSRCTPEYFTSGQWVGFYTYTAMASQTPGEWELPIRDLNFTVENIGSREPPNQDIKKDASTLLLRASGTNVSGSFNLTFTCDSDGFLAGMETYENPPWEWQWVMSNTPFGICGVWTGVVDEFRNFGQAQGAIWLWKKEWYDEQDLQDQQHGQDEPIHELAVSMLDI